MGLGHGGSVIGPDQTIIGSLSHHNFDSVVFLFRESLFLVGHWPAIYSSKKLDPADSIVRDSPGQSPYGSQL
jgi:hypothetical protein